jgi:hypothetical protein
VVIAIVVVLAVVAAGCGQRYDQRTGRRTLDRAITRAFKRAYAASYRAVHARPYKGVILRTAAQCRPDGSQPKSTAKPWNWTCRLRYYRSGIRERSVYRVAVDQRGCFVAHPARPDQFPATLREKVLGGRVTPNPLLRIRSCP